jgi:hypothetical protein
MQKPANVLLKIKADHRNGSGWFEAHRWPTCALPALRAKRRLLVQWLLDGLAANQIIGS